MEKRLITFANTCLSQLQGYYRLGSCLIALGRKSEALTYFCEGLKNAVTEDDRFSLTIQVVNTAMDLKGTVSLMNTFQGCR